MYQVKVWITTRYSNGSDLEEMDFFSNKSLRAAKSLATRWINKNYFQSDIISLRKNLCETRARSDYELVIKGWDI